MHLRFSATSARRTIAQVSLALLLGLALTPGRARAWILYDASLGTLPPAQGWALNEDINPPMSYPSGVAGGNLYLNTLEFAAGGTNGGGVWWSRSDVAIDFINDFAVEASVRINLAPDHSVNTVAGWPRPGFAIAVTDIAGRLFWIGLGSGEIFLSNSVYGQYGSGNTVFTAFNTTDTHHVYRIERAAGGVGAALRVDGVLKLTLPALSGTSASLPEIYFGDPTYWANSESYTAWIRYSGAVLGVEASKRADVLWAKPPTCPSSMARVAFGSPAEGSLAFELFDAAGRRLQRSERVVAAGERGSFDAAGAHPNGLYFYRVSLAPGSGPAQEVRGRLVLVR